MLHSILAICIATTTILLANPPFLFAKNTTTTLADSKKDAIPSVSTRFNLKGIHCGECVKKIKLKMGAIKGVSSVDVSISENATVITHLQSLDIPTMVAQFKKLGYEATPVSPNRLKLIQYKVTM